MGDLNENALLSGEDYVIYPAMMQFQDNMNTYQVRYLAIGFCFAKGIIPLYFYINPGKNSPFLSILQQTTDSSGYRPMIYTVFRIELWQAAILWMHFFGNFIRGKRQNPGKNNSPPP